MRSRRRFPLRAAPSVAWARMVGGLALTLAVLLPLHAAEPPASSVITGRTATAIFAGGCFWCMEADFEKLPGVLSAESGYTDGRVVNPSYQAVSAGTTGHTEAIRVVYDTSQLSYSQLLDHFWRNVDPTVKDRQFCDIGNQYRSGIYWRNELERRAAENSQQVLLKSGRVKEIYTEIKAVSAFYPAEAYHQDYYKKNPLRYAYYRQGCGRDARLKALWGG